MFPRKFTQREKDFLFYLLPADRKGYSEYRKFMEDMAVIGTGSFGEGNFFLGSEGDVPDFSYPSAPVFACGQVICENCVIQITVHEISDNKLEFSISNLSAEEIPDELNEIRRWSYSYWKPGERSPFENDNLWEYKIGSGFVLAVSPANRSIWLYDQNSEVNHIIPVTNFINELLQVSKAIPSILPPKGARGMIDYVLTNLDKFTAENFRQALIEYNKHWHKINLHVKT